MTIYNGVAFEWQMIANNIGDGDTFASIIFTYTIPAQLYWNSYHCATTTTIEYSINSGASYSGTPPGDLHTLTNVRITYPAVVLEGESTIPIYMNMTPNVVNADVLSTFTVTTSGDQGSSNNTDNHHLAVVAFSPVAFSGMKLWLDAQTTVYTSIAPDVAAANTDPVARWDDRSTAPIHVDQATVGKQPIYNTGLANGLNGLTFDGVDDFMTIANTFTQPTSSAYTAFFVVTPTNSSSTVGGEDLIVTGAIDWYHKTPTGAQTATGMLSGVSVELDPAQAGLQLYTFTSTTNAFEFFRDGVSVATATGSVNQALTGGKLGSNSAGTDKFFAGVIYEILVYNSVLSSVNRGLVEQYLISKYAI